MARPSTKHGGGQENSEAKRRQCRPIPTQLPQASAACCVCVVVCSTINNHAAASVNAGSLTMGNALGIPIYMVIGHAHLRAGWQ
eukprot:4671523-Amphidinium_carterae.1